MTTSGPAQRAVVPAARSTAFAVTSTVLACVAHGAGAGEPPDVGTAVLLTALLAFTGRPLVTRCRGTVDALLLLGLSQAVLHLGFAWLSGLTHHGYGAGAGMLVGHAAAALLTGLVLARADAAVLAVARALAAWWPVVPSAFRAHRPLWVALVADDRAAVRTAPPRRTTPRRGPPAPS
ncbi:hypothetical protein [Saccharothrix sp. Mg75]|uniref:hypothetical protein n=1 Tax=Saccharothrix sp. Mg75 TaxID=3445357 RepID=UPI003EEC93C3